MSRRRRRNQPRRMLYMRATAVVFNANEEVLLVKHYGENDWALPGGRLIAAEEPERRAVIEVAQETGLQLKDVRFAGRYAGTVASHKIFVGMAQGEPRPDLHEIQDAMWWDKSRPVVVQQHVNSILALVGEPGSH